MYQMYCTTKGLYPSAVLLTSPLTEENALFWLFLKHSANLLRCKPCKSVGYAALFNLPPTEIAVKVFFVVLVTFNATERTNHAYNVFVQTIGHIFQQVNDLFAVFHGELVRFFVVYEPIKPTSNSVIINILDGLYSDIANDGVD